VLTKKQQKWINHLSDEDKIKIIPFDPSAEEKFRKVKTQIQTVLGKKTDVRHCGATSLGISGQNEIDVYVPVLPTIFNDLIKPLKKAFGEPKSHYLLERARFTTEVEGKHVDIFLINKKCGGWIKGLKFENYLRKHPEELKNYRKLKEKGNGLSVREYYRKKIKYLNSVLKKDKNYQNQT